MIAREGVGLLTAMGGAAVGVSFATGPTVATVVVWLFTIAAIWIYYERKPNCPAAPHALICPLAGSVERIDRCWNPWLNGNCLRVRVKVTAPFIGTVWSPTEGKILEFWTKAAAFDGPAGRPVDGESPNCYALHIQTDEGQDAVLALSSAWPISRLKLDVGPGNRAGQGRRLGFCYFIGYADLLIDPGSCPRVSVGDKVSAGESVLAAFTDREPHA